MKAGPEPDSLGAVVVTYRPEGDFVGRLERVRRQVARVLIVDNASQPPQRRMLQEAAARDGVELLQNECNRGLAAALNQGIAWARQKGFAWVLTMDQDSLVDAAMMQEIGAIYRQYPDPQRIGWIGANFTDPLTSRAGVSPDRRPADGNRFIAVRTAISSGAVLSLRALEQIGPFREDYFIDSVDHEYCLRLRREGFAVLVSRRTLMVHPIGQASLHGALGWRVVCLNHPAQRRYYRTRNRLATARAYKWQEPRWALCEACDIVREATCIALWEQDKRAKLRAMVLGAWDGLRGRMGPCRQLEPTPS